MINFISAYSSLLTTAFLLTFLLIEDWTGCFTEEGDYYYFNKAVSNIYFEKVLMINFISSLLQHFFFPNFLLIKDFKQCAVQKELIINPFVERFPTTAMRKHYWAILLALKAMCFRTFFGGGSNVHFLSALENELLSKKDLK